MIPSELLNLVNEAENMVVLTGAGISAESGIPTFRDKLTGVWAKFDPTIMASPQGYEANPALVTRWYDERRLQLNECEPNPGHQALMELETIKIRSGKKFTLITQNVDGLHRRAGSLNVIEMHGTLLRWRGAESGETVTPDPHQAFEDYPPMLNGERMRPDVVWFGEMLATETLTACGEAIANTDLFITVGTSGEVFPANLFLGQAKQSGATTCLINLEDTPNSDQADFFIQGKAGEILPHLVSTAS